MEDDANKNINCLGIYANISWYSIRYNKHSHITFANYIVKSGLPKVELGTPKFYPNLRDGTQQTHPNPICTFEVSQVNNILAITVASHTLRLTFSFF